jgi:hypothetical protein
MTEAEVRQLLRRCDGSGGLGLEAWIADQPWEAKSGGWQVIPDLHGWRFRLELVGDGVGITASPPGSAAPAVWIVTG